MGISRLTDPARQPPHLNLSLGALLEDERLRELPELRAELSALVKLADVRAKPIHKIRHKWIAHRDRAVALGDAELPDVPDQTISEVVDLLTEIHRLYNLRARQVTVDPDAWRGGGVEALLETLRSTPDRWERLLAEEDRDLARLRHGREGEG